MFSDTTVTNEFVDGAVGIAIEASISLAHQEMRSETPNMVRVSQCLRLSTLLVSGLEDFRFESIKDDNELQHTPEVSSTSTSSEDETMAEITSRLRNAWVIRKGALINFSQNSGWSYNIPKTTFIKVIETIKGFAPQGEFQFEDMVVASGIKDSHVYRIYVLLFRAGLMRQQKANKYFINEQEAKRLDPELIWKHLPKD